MVFLPGKSCGQRSSVGYSPWGHRELDTTEHMHIRQRWSFQNGVQLWAGLGPRSEPGCWIVSPGRMEPQNSSSVHTGLLKGGSVWWLESRCWGQTVWIWILLLPSANCVILITSLCLHFLHEMGMIILLLTLSSLWRDVKHPGQCLTCGGTQWRLKGCLLANRFPRLTEVVNNPPANAGDIRDAGSVPRLGRSPGKGNGNPLQYSFLENSMDRGAWRATVHGVARVRHDWVT